MSLTLRVLAPDQNVFDGSADEVILPSTTGQLGILPGHISLLTAIDVGVLRVRSNGGWNSSPRNDVSPPAPRGGGGSARPSAPRPSSPRPSAPRSGGGRSGRGG